MLNMVFSNKKTMSIIFLIVALMIPLAISSIIFETNVEGNCNGKHEGLSNNEITRMKQHMKDMNKHMKTAPDIAKK